MIGHAILAESVVAADLADWLPSLRNPLRRQLLLEWLGKKETEALDAGDVLILLVDDYLRRNAPISPEQGDAIIRGLRTKLQALGRLLHDSMTAQTDQLPGLFLCLLDRKLVGVSGSDQLLDLTSGKFATGLPRMPTECIQINLTSLFVRLHAKRRGRHDRASSSADGMVDKP